MGRPCKGENCRVNRQTVEGTELQSKQAKIGRERVAEYTGRGWKGESCRVYRQRVEGRELQNLQADGGRKRVAE